MGAKISKHGVHLVLPDGSNIVAEGTITVREVLLRYPHCFVTSAGRILNGASGKNLKLSSDKILSVGKTYFVRPNTERHKSRTEWAKDAEVAAVLKELLDLKGEKTESKPRKQSRSLKHQHPGKFNGPATPTGRLSSHPSKDSRSASWGSAAALDHLSSVTSWEAAAFLPNSAPDLMVDPNPPSLSGPNSEANPRGPSDSWRDQEADRKEDAISDVDNLWRKHREHVGGGISKPGQGQGVHKELETAASKSKESKEDDDSDEVFQAFLQQMQAFQEGTLKGTGKWKPFLENIEEAKASMLPHVTVVTRFRGKGRRGGGRREDKDVGTLPKIEGQ